MYFRPNNHAVQWVYHQSCPRFKPRTTAKSKQYHRHVSWHKIFHMCGAKNTWRMYLGRPFWWRQNNGSSFSRQTFFNVQPHPFHLTAKEKRLRASQFRESARPRRLWRPLRVNRWCTIEQDNRRSKTRKRQAKALKLFPAFCCTRDISQLNGVKKVV